MQHAKFKFQSVDEVEALAGRMGLTLHLAQGASILSQPVIIGGWALNNRLAFQPMEGADARGDGGPDELPIRRYRRFAKGGAGLVWFEAIAIRRQGRANPRQMWIHRDNVSDFKNLIDEYRQLSKEAFGEDFRPRLVAQLTHSGRFSRPDGAPEPVIACHHPELDSIHHIDPRLEPISDDELDALQEDYLEAARLCALAGFDAVDIKCCHRYLINELLSAFDRPGRYGGSFENRARLLLETVDKVRSALGDRIKVCTRLNGFDALPRGFGTDAQDPLTFAPEEPVRLLRELEKRGVDLVNITMGSPYYAPHVNRPFDVGPYVPDEHPLEGVARMMRGTEMLRKAVPGVKLVGSGLTWLRQFGANLAAGEILNGSFDIAGFGRMGFAYPDFAADIAKNGALDPKKCCIACTKCSEIMKRCGQAGCVVRDAKMYAPIYRKIVGR